MGDADCSVCELTNDLITVGDKDEETMIIDSFPELVVTETETETSFTLEYEQHGCTSYYNTGFEHRPFNSPYLPEFSADKCAEACLAKNYDYFGFECPMTNDVHCQCYSAKFINDKPVKEAECKKRVGEYGNKHCIGPGMKDGFSLGGADIGSIYKCKKGSTSSSTSSTSTATTGGATDGSSVGACPSCCSGLEQEDHSVEWITSQDDPLSNVTAIGSEVLMEFANDELCGGEASLTQNMTATATVILPEATTFDLLWSAVAEDQYETLTITVNGVVKTQFTAKSDGICTVSTCVMCVIKEQS